MQHCFGTKGYLNVVVAGMQPGCIGWIFTDNKEIIFAFHGYVGIIHDLVYGRKEPGKFHVRGYMEEGTTTTPLI